MICEDPARPDPHSDRTYYANQLKLSSPEAIILEAKDGQAGLGLRKAQKVDCIVTDFTLPDMSSFELLSDVNLIPLRASLGWL